MAQVLAALLALPQLPAVLNIAQPGLVEMGTLLDAAGRDWTAHPAPDAAIARVALDCSLVQDLVPVPTADPRPMVQQWRELEPPITGKQGRI